jgi:hypothetical protein
MLVFQVSVSQNASCVSQCESKYGDTGRQFAALHHSTQSNVSFNHNLASALFYLRVHSYFM